MTIDFFHTQKLVTSSPTFFSSPFPKVRALPLREWHLRSLRVCCGRKSSAHRIDIMLGGCICGVLVLVNSIGKIFLITQAM